LNYPTLIRGITENFVDRIWSDESLIQLDFEKITTQQLFQSMVGGGIKGMLFLKEFVPHLWHRGIVLYGGDVAFPLTEDIIALPISALWAK
jgi:hypothetical protein